MISLKELLIEDNNVKIYVQKGKKPPKGKTLKKGPRGGQYFIGSPSEKQTYEKGGNKKPAAKPEINIFNQSREKDQANAYDAYRKVKEWLPKNPTITDEFIKLVGTRKIKGLTKFIDKYADPNILKKYLKNTSTEDLAVYMIKSKGYFDPNF